MPPAREPHLISVRLGLTGAKAQVSVGWKEIHALAERFFCIGIQMRLPFNHFLIP
jgi:hypothetical protein